MVSANANGDHANDFPSPLTSYVGEVTFQKHIGSVFLSMHCVHCGNHLTYVSALTHVNYTQILCPTTAPGGGGGAQGVSG